jgi:hypothetical protein
LETNRYMVLLLACFPNVLAKLPVIEVGENL